MIQHIIAISTSYVLGTRIAWHYADNKISPSVLEELSKKKKSILGSPEYSIHKLNTGQLLEKFTTTIKPMVVKLLKDKLMIENIYI